MVSPVFPYPANTGGLVRIARLFEGLGRFHQVTLLTPVLPEQWPDAERLREKTGADIVPVPTSRRSQVRILRALLSPRPYHLSLLYESKMRIEADRLLSTQTFSAMYLNFLYTLPYVPPSWSRPVVLDQQNVDRIYWRRKARSRATPPLKRFLSLINQHKTVRYEDQQLRSITAFVSVSESDAKQTREYAEPTVNHFIVAPNGVELVSDAPRDVTDNKSEISLGFLGSLDLDLNKAAALALCRQIVPAVRDRYPQLRIRVLLIGRNPDDRLRALAREDPGITLTGTVPDVTPYLQQVDILVLPLEEGAGTKVRTLEAMALGIPIVGTALAFEGLEDATDGSNMLLASTPAEFAIRIGQLIDNPDLRASIALHARTLATRFSWQAITRNLADDLASLVHLREAALP